MARPVRRRKLDRRILEELGLSIDEFGDLTDDEQDYLVQCIEEMAETGTSPTAADLLLEDFKWQPVSMEQFLSDPYYMGELTGKMFPLVRAALIDIFDTGNVPMYTMLGGSIGWGKSMMSSCILIYLLYRLSCLRDPHAYYELVKGNKIYLAVYSVNLDQALDGIYGKVLNWVDQIPYFTHKCPRVKRVNSVIKFTDCPVEMIVASKPDHTIGKDVFACCLDEGSFFRSTGGMSGDEVADAIYTGTESRLSSRFMQAGGHIPGMIIVASSKTTKQSFYEKKVKDLKPQFVTGRARVFAYSQWEVKPASNYVLPRFQVEIGDRVFPSRLLGEGEAPRPGADTIWVPGEFLSPFKQDVDKALRDLAGIASEGMLPLFRDKRVITDCCDLGLQHPFTRQSVTLDVASDLNLDAYFKPETLFRIVRSKYELRLNPNSPRFVGMDLALTGDSLGMAMCHISGFKKVQRVRADGTFYDDRAPVIVFDFVLEIKPPLASEIDLSKARAFVLSLRDYGIEIARISLDTSNSRDMVQTFRKLGFDCNLQSVSRTDEQYLAFRQGIVEKRVRYYEYAPLISNLSRVERDMEKRKVIHPKTSDDGFGHGDVSDAATQAYWAALTDKRTLLPEVNYRDMIALTSQDTTVTTPGGNVLWNVLDSEARK
jgi:phage FluMu protein Com